MLVSYRWLCELVPRLDRDPSEVAEALTAVGLAVDGVTDHETALRPLLLVEVLEVAPHPTRSTLQLVTVRTRPVATVGSPALSMAPPSRQAPAPVAPELLTVVCGASNVPAAGGVVVLAGLGLKLPGVDFVLTRRDIGGVFSEGMLCSEAELGLAEASDGILTFAPGTHVPGTRFIDAFPEARDVVFELDVTPNRPDALGHVGVARDLAALFELELVLPQAAAPAEAGPEVSQLVTVVNETPERCPRYGLAIVNGARIAPSPAHMRWRLHRLGTRPISNVVDVTNWILLEFGQPLHAFDLAHVRGQRIVIRTATAGETLVTLDGQTRVLVGDDVVIADGEGPTALAGVMGGQGSEIGQATQSVLLECAYFSPRSVRRTARRQGMRTESSHRFERGTDHGATDVVLDRARSLLCELSGATAAPGTARADGAAIEIPAIEFRNERMDRLLGVDVPFKEATRTLGRLGFHVEYARDTKSGQVALVRGASHRPDVAIEADLIEEVARIRGLDAIPTVLPAIPPQAPRLSGKMLRQASQSAVELGLSEALTYSFVARRDLELLSAPEPVVTLSNPLTEERSVLRTSLLPGLIEALRRAGRRGEKRVQLFSLGSIFLPVDTAHTLSEARPEQPEDRGRLPYEQPTFAAILAGPRDEHLVLNPADVDIYDAKAVAVGMVERMTGRSARVSREFRLLHLHPRGAASIEVEGRAVGSFGPLHPDVVQAFDLDGPALVVELDLAAIEAVGRRGARYQPIPKLPAIRRDLSLVVSDLVPASEVLAAIALAGGPLCESVEVATEFRGGSVPDGHRSLTFRVVYRDPAARRNADDARTLTDKEVDDVEARVLESTRQQLGVTLRG